MLPWILSPGATLHYSSVSIADIPANRATTICPVSNSARLHISHTRLHWLEKWANAVPKLLPNEQKKKGLDGIESVFSAYGMVYWTIVYRPIRVGCTKKFSFRRWAPGHDRRIKRDLKTNPRSWNLYWCFIQICYAGAWNNFQRRVFA